MRLQKETAFYLEDGAPVFSDDRFSKNVKSYFVEDTNYHIISVHDLPIIRNQDWTATYSDFKEKLNTRIQRFQHLMNTSKSILFVRWSASYQQAVELQSALRKSCKGLIHVIILNPIDGLANVVEKDWGLERVCSLEVPNNVHNNATWDTVLKGVSLT